MSRSTRLAATIATGVGAAAAMWYLLRKRRSTPKLGSYSQTVLTASRECQEWFDRGCVWAYNLHREEALPPQSTADSFP